MKYHYICNYCGKDFENSKTKYREHHTICESKPQFFECSFCGRRFSKKGVCSNHEKHDCLKNSNRVVYARIKNFKRKAKNDWKCDICDEVFRTRDLRYQHLRNTHNIINKRGGCQEKNKVEGFCKYCNHKSSTKSGLAFHEKYCRLNPNQVSSPRKGIPMKDATKKKISEALKTFYDENPEKVPFKINHSSKESFPEKYFREWLENEKLYDEQEFSVGRYSLDFAWPEKKIYIEVDGSQHKLDWMVLHDEERTKVLSEKGWKLIRRIDWSEFQSYSDGLKEEFLDKLKNEITG